MKYFITYGSECYQPSVERILNEAKQLNIFDYTFSLDSSIFDDKFKELRIIKEKCRGDGYWLWKPYIINFVLGLMEDNDVLLYCDAGCKLFPQNKARLLEYFSFTLGSMIYVVEASGAIIAVPAIK